MKETAKAVTIDAKDLVKEGVYFSTTNHLVQVKDINTEKKELHLLNISEQIHLYFIPFNRHTLAKRVR